MTADLLKFLNDSPCNFLAVKNITERLDNAGFKQIEMSESWELQPGDRRYVVKNSSAVFAFIVGSDPAAGFKIISAHSDSPGFRIKPNAEIVNEGGIVTLNTEVYGGPILYTWFDRPLSISGRVILRSNNPLKPITRFVNFGRPLLTIPHLAIHYNRSVNDGNPLSKQRDMLPVLGRVSNKEEGKGLLTRMVANELGVNPEEILDFDLTLYDTTPACTFGLNDEFISSGRIDDLEMAHAALTSLLASAENTPAPSSSAASETSSAAPSAAPSAASLQASSATSATSPEAAPSAASPQASQASPQAASCISGRVPEAQASGCSFPAQTRVMAIFDNEETGSGTKQGAASPILQAILRRICGDYETYSRAVARSFMISADNGHALHPNYPSKQDPTNHPIPGDGPVVKINANCKYMTDAHSAAVYRAICQKAGVNLQAFVNHSDTPGGSTLGNILTSQIELEGVDMGAPQWAMHSCRETASVADYLSTISSFTEFYKL